MPRGGLDASQIEKAADGRRRGAVGETRQAVEVEPQRRVAADGALDERGPTRRIRVNQTQEAADPQAQVGAGFEGPPQNLRPQIFKPQIFKPKARGPQSVEAAILAPLRP